MMSRSNDLHLPPLRRWARPRAGDTLESLARRELPEIAPEEAVKLLGEWNGHLVRLSFVVGRELLVSDIVYLEPPPGQG